MSATPVNQSSSPPAAQSFSEVDVWLEAGRDGRTFIYCDSLSLGVGLGDLVVVRLRGRRLQGLVTGCRLITAKANSADSDGLQLNPVEELVQRAAVDPSWRSWLDAMAVLCHTSPFRMLKAALPPGWLGQRPGSTPALRQLWWIERLEAADPSALPKATRQSALLAELERRGGGAWQRDLLAEGFQSGTVKSLESKGLIRRQRKSESGPRASDQSAARAAELESPRSLTDEQQSVVNRFQSLPEGGGLLLWGITGSGKTEVYLQLAAAELVAGRHVLLLTPEIGLIPQLVDRCRQRFGERVLEYHSGCTPRERVRTWRRCLVSGDPVVVVGTRSAVFLPLRPLGLLVLDEEHDNSYKQDSPMPCYHARVMASERVKLQGGRLLLGSATPSLESWSRLQPHGSLVLARLRSRISSQPLPPVRIIDMRHELAEGNKRLISRALMDRLAQLPEKGEQAVVLVPRRGYSTFLSCRSCGEVVMCPHCDVPLTVHGSRGAQQWLRCHWCDHRAPITPACSSCGSLAFKPFGAGTQRVLERLGEELSDLRLLRFDRDTTGGRDGHRRLLDQFAEGEADVLVGTQMLAKGMDLPRVTLAAVLAADGLLHRPDLRAGEQCLQLLLQLAGRAGRAEKPGEVLVQTYSPDHPVIRHLVDGRYERFLEEESTLRREAGLVPFARACLIRLSGESASDTATAGTLLAERIRAGCAAAGWQLLGPAPAPVARVAGRSRWQLLLHGPQDSEIPLPPGTGLWEGLPKDVSLSVDPDPLQL
ncbi:primosomal protein N' [Synechococcus sp. MIT S9508]|uniref:replication restart helicase PriA n=1 Tax=Synechococcus sp. MIT S9508 TaxID=1801629 RepID=UPI0007BBCE55|nr:primosomal protein N' [Synechococcus sp. MIT S9508]KZR90940.1 Primosomal protein N' [Synechococcus sp. MIT S9508]